MNTEKDKARMRAWAAAKYADPKGRQEILAATKQYAVSTHGHSTRQKYRKSCAGKRVARNNQLLKKFGLSLIDWEQMFVAQGSCCAVCGSFDPGNKRGDWHTDHSHTTGKVRAILCAPCNLTLGHSRESIVRLKSLIQYLEEGV